MTYPPYDQRLANEAAAADQCMKLGAVILKSPSRSVGFSAPVPPVAPINPERVSRAIDFHRRAS